MLNIDTVSSLDFDNFVKFIDGNKACTFATILYRSKETGELARHTIMLNPSRRSMLEQDLAKLKALRPNLTLAVLKQACDELIDSITETLTTGKNSRYTKPGYYAKNGNGNVDTSIKNVAYIRCYVINKKVIEPGHEEPDTRREKTKAKDALRDLLKNTRCREFIITPDLFKIARIRGKAVIIDASASSLSKIAGLAPVAMSVPVSA